MTISDPVEIRLMPILGSIIVYFARDVGIHYGFLSNPAPPPSQHDKETLKVLKSLHIVLRDIDHNLTELREESAAKFNELKGTLERLT